MSAIKTLVSDKLAEALALNSKLTALNQEIEAARTAELRELHTAFGYASPAEFVVAYNNANGSNGTTPARRGSRKATRTAKPAKATKGKGGKANGNGRKARVSITPERREEIKKFFKGGGTTMEAMTKFNIAYATAQNIKEEAGMVEKRS